MARANGTRYCGRERQHRASRRTSPAEVCAEVLQMEYDGFMVDCTISDWLRAMELAYQAVSYRELIASSVNAACSKKKVVCRKINGFFVV